MTVLLSIKPEFAKKIFDGTKKFEYRKSIFKYPDVGKVIVYASSPIKKIIGEFEIAGILNDEVKSVWKETSRFSGVSKKFYLTYFKNKEKAYAIKIRSAKYYEPAKNLSDFNIRTAPQSFVYLK